MEYKDLSPEYLSNFVDYKEHETVRRIQSPESGLISYVAVHNTNLGPSLGGCRIWAYKNEEDAIRDVLRLSRGMTYKNALAGLPLGGGKSVIIADPYKDKTEQMIIDMAKGVDAMGGSYITAEDSGLSEDDVKLMTQHTDYVTGFSTPGSELGGNPSPVTAYGVFCAMRSAVYKRYNKPTLEGLTIAVQGLGAVGYALTKLMYDDGAKIIACDIREQTIEKARSEMPNIEIVELDQIFDCEADIFAPCAMGAQLNSETIPRLKVDLVVGAANNQLATPKDIRTLEAQNILYAPDYVVNSGGVIAVAYEYSERLGINPFEHELTRENMIAHVERSAKNVEMIFDYAEKSGISTAEAADQMAEKVFSVSASDARSNSGYCSSSQTNVYKTAAR